MKKSPITTHILDTSEGRPAAGVAVELRRLGTDSGKALGKGRTDADGRLMDWLPESFRLKPGVYEIRFDTGTYFKKTRRTGFYPVVRISFSVRSTAQHYHVPLLLNPWGFSTYRGS